MAKLGIANAFQSLAEVESRLELRRNDEATFFLEWRDNLPQLDQAECDRLSIIRQRLLYHRADGDLLEGSVMLLVASPLLELAGFYDPPFKLKAEVAIEVSVDDGEEILRGRIDALILQHNFWVLVLEAKKTTISTRSALPQALAYMIANTNPEQPTFGMLTNGDDVLFIKLIRQSQTRQSQTRQSQNQYSLSRVFSLYTLPEELQAVLQILKCIGGAIAPP
jgi:hypothetical protein